MLTFVERTGSSSTQLRSMGLELRSQSSSRFLFEELDLLMTALASTGAEALMTVVEVLVGVDILEAAVKDMWTVVMLFLNDLLVLMRVVRAGRAKKLLQAVVGWLQRRKVGEVTVSGFMRKVQLKTLARAVIAIVASLALDVVKWKYCRLVLAVRI